MEKAKKIIEDACDDSQWMRSPPESFKLINKSAAIEAVEEAYKEGMAHTTDEVNKLVNILCKKYPNDHALGEIIRVTFK